MTRYLFIGCVVMASGVGLLWFSESNTARGRFIKQVCQCIWPMIVLVGALIMIAGI